MALLVANGRGIRLWDSLVFKLDSDLLPGDDHLGRHGCRQIQKDFDGTD